jgi:hypothetical protein
MISMNIEYFSFFKSDAILISALTPYLTRGIENAELAARRSCPKGYAMGDSSDDKNEC